MKGLFKKIENIVTTKDDNDREPYLTRRLVHRDVFMKSQHVMKRGGGMRKLKGVRRTPMQRLVFELVYADGRKETEIQYQELDRSRNKLNSKP